MILIITNKEDIHPTPVIQHLDDMGVGCFRLNTESLLTDYDFEWTCNSQKGDNFRITNIHTGKEIWGNEVKAVWERRPLPPSELRFSNRKEINKHNLEEAHGFLSFLLYYLGDRFCLGHHLYDRSAGSKMLQLKIAHKLGMTIPDTCFSNNKESIAKSMGKYDTLCLKAIDNDNIWLEEELQEHVLYSQLVDTQELLKLSVEAFAQTVTYLQNYVEKDYELRITLVGSEIFSCSIDSQRMSERKGRVDWRQGLDHGLIHTPHSLPEKVGDFCRQFLTELGLNFGCFDFIVTPEGDYVFIECNPNGQWLWIEHEAGLGISKCIADTLAFHDRQ